MKAKHSKVLHISHSSLEMADYLKPNGITNTEARFLFSIRCRMLDVRVNYEGQHSDTLCPLCDEEEDSQHHLLVCEVLGEAGQPVVVVDQPPVYEKIFNGTLDEKIYVSRIIEERFSERKKILKHES